jgi:selenocysteine-specific elongation factor
VSGRTGEGLDDLRSALATVLASVPPPDPAAPVRLWVDRSFHVRGAGTVVTGTLPAGTVAPGTVLSAGGAEVRVRGVEALGVARPSVSGVARVALDLGGHAPPVDRGDPLVAVGAFEVTARVDVRIRGEGEPPERPVLHVGSAHVGTRTRVVGLGLARLVLDRPLPLRYGDRAILRDPGNRRVWGVEVVDPVPARRPRDLAAHDGTPAAELRMRGVVRRSLLRRIGAPADPLPEGTLVAGDWLVAPDLVAGLRLRLAELADRPVAPAEAANALALPDPAIVTALVAPPLRLEAGRVVGPGGLPAALVEAADLLRGELSGFAAPRPGGSTSSGWTPPRWRRCTARACCCASTSASCSCPARTTGPSTYWPGWSSRSPPVPRGRRSAPRAASRCRSSRTSTRPAGRSASRTTAAGCADDGVDPGRARPSSR